MIKVLILDDEVLIARRLESIAAMYADQVVLANTYEQASKLMEEFQPDLLLLDINLQKDGRTGIDFAKEFKAKHYFEIIFITAYFDTKTLNEASTVAPINYIVKPFKKDQIDVVLKLLIPRLKGSIHEQKASDNIKILTKEERRLMHMISLGYPSKVIADQLNKSVKTVTNQRSSIMKKLGLPPFNNSLLVWAIENKSAFKDEDIEQE
jgi:DNA-binding NarL/FixJ family response regulator